VLGVNVQKISMYHNNLCTIAMWGKNCSDQVKGEKDHWNLYFVIDWKVDN
jgi:hypothetical protein